MRSWNRLRTAAVALAALGALSLGACSSGPAPAETGAAESGAPGAAGAFPVTIEHAFGETTIEAEPERVVTWGWGSADAAIALGVIPVAIPFESYAGDEEGVLPCIREALDEAGAQTPTILANSGDEPPFEEILAADPDVILAPYSGLTQEQYDLLSGIAPVVAYPEEPWATPWRDIVTLTAQALGREAEGEELLAGIDAQIADAAEAHPEFAGKTIAAVWDFAGSFYVYKEADPRVEFLLDLGFVSAPSVAELQTDEATFYYTLSYENLDRLQSDVLLAYAGSQEEADAFLGAGYAQSMSQVQDGTVATLVGTEFISAVSPPTALSLTWGLDEVVESLVPAATAAG